jgi:DNA (cytosine-5)-methyltransferase 3A
LNVLSLFDGMSCGQIALERAGIKVDKYYASEIDKYAIKITQKNYPNTIQLGDINEVDFTKLKGEITLAIGGSPCTYWSIARDGRETDSSGIGFELFMQYVRAVRESEAKYFLYENNFGIHKDIQREISKQLGVEPIMINSALVSAQNRKRLYWTNIPGVAQPNDLGILLKDVVLDHEYTIGAAMRGRYDENGKVRQQIEIRKDSKSNALTTVQKDCLLVNRCYQVGTAQEIRGNDSIKRVYSTEGKAPTLTTMQGGHREPKIAIDDVEWRKLTPLECERLQTVPDTYTEGVSNTQRYKMLGNGWTVDVIAHIFKGLNGAK